jgi:hypothetical protein
MSNYNKKIKQKNNKKRKAILHAMEGVIAGLLLIFFASNALSEPLDINSWQISRLNQESREFINSFEKANFTELIIKNKQNETERLIKDILNDRVGFSIKTTGLLKPVLSIGLVIDSTLTEEQNNNQFLRFRNNIANNIEGENTIININGRETLLYIEKISLEENINNLTKYEILIIPIPLTSDKSEFTNSAKINTDISNKINTHKNKLEQYLQTGKGIILISNFIDISNTQHNIITDLFSIEWKDTPNIPDITHNTTINDIPHSYESNYFKRLYQATPIIIETKKYDTIEHTNNIVTSNAISKLSTTNLELGNADCYDENCGFTNPMYKNENWIKSLSGNYRYNSSVYLAKNEYNIITVDENTEFIYDTIYIDIDGDGILSKKYGSMNCSYLTQYGQSTCNNQLGCNWDNINSICNNEYKKTPCEYLDQTYCNTQDGCTWNNPTNLCQTNTNTQCIDIGTENQCKTQHGCLWTSTCINNPQTTQCPGLNQTTCGETTYTQQRGCKWNHNTNSCQNANWELDETKLCETNTKEQCGYTSSQGQKGCAWNPKKNICEPKHERFELGDIISLNESDYKLTYISKDGSYIKITPTEIQRKLIINNSNQHSKVYKINPFDTFDEMGIYNNNNTKTNNSQYILAHINSSDNPKLPVIITNNIYNGKTSWISNNLNTLDEWNLLKTLIIYTSNKEHEFISKPTGKTNVISTNKISTINEDIYQPYIIEFKMWSYV